MIQTNSLNNILGQCRWRYYIENETYRFLFMSCLCHGTNRGAQQRGRGGHDFVHTCMCQYAPLDV